MATDLTSFETLRAEQRDAVVWVWLDRPDRYHAFNKVMCDEISGLWRSLRTDASVRSVVLTARGRQKIGRVMADVAPVIGRSLQAMAHQANGNLLQQLAAFETALDQQTLAQRFTAGRKT